MNKTTCYNCDTPIDTTGRMCEKCRDQNLRLAGGAVSSLCDAMIEHGIVARYPLVVIVTGFHLSGEFVAPSMLCCPPSELGTPAENAFRHLTLDAMEYAISMVRRQAEGIGLLARLDDRIRTLPGSTPPRAGDNGGASIEISVDQEGS